MTHKHIYLVLLLFSCTSVVQAQDYSYKNQNKIPGSINPSFYGFENTSKGGLIYSTETIGGNNKIENKFAFANLYLEDYGFSLAVDLTLYDVSDLGYSISQANAHYIYNTDISYNWILNSSISVGYVTSKLNFNSLVFEDQIDVLTGNIAGITIDPVSANSTANYFDIGAGFHVHNSKNLYFGLNAKHINRPDASFNSEVSDEKDMMLSLQVGYELDLNPYNQRSLPNNSFLFLYSSMTKQGPKSTLDFYQEAILDNFSFGVNQRINNYEGASITTFGASVGFFMEEIEIGANYSFEVASKNLTGISYNIIEFYFTYDFDVFKEDRRGNNSRFFSF